MTSTRESSPAPLLSVTVLNYNYGHYLANCLDSILGQTLRDFELLLVNDKSTDDSLQVIRPYLADPRVRLVDHEVNQGFVRSLIEGSQLSRGRYISVISADDWVADPTAFEKQLAVLESHPDAVMAFSAYGLYESPEHVPFVSRAASGSYVRPGREVFGEFLLHGYPQHSGTVVRRSAYEALGGYDPTLKYSVDAQLFLGICHFGQVAYVDEPLYAYRRHPSSMSKDPRALRAAILELFRLIDWSFAFLPEAERQRLRGVYARARARALTTFASDAIFSGNPRLGLRFFRVGLQLSPVETLWQKSTAAMALRLLLGSRGYRLIESIRGAGRPAPAAQPAGQSR